MKSLKYIIGKDTKFGNIEINSINDLQDYDIVRVPFGWLYYMFFKDKNCVPVGFNSSYPLPVLLREGGRLIVNNKYNQKTLRHNDPDFDIVKVYRPFKTPKFKFQDDLSQDYLKDLIENSELIFER